MKLSEQTPVGSSGPSLVLPQAPLASGRTPAGKELSAGFSDLVEFVVDPEANQPSEHTEIGNSLNVSTLGTDPTSAITTKAAFFETFEEVETLAPETALPSHVPLDIATQDLVLEVDGPAELVGADLSNYANFGTRPEVTTQIQQQPDIEIGANPHSDTKDDVAYMDNPDQPSGLTAQKTDDARVLGQPGAMVSFANEAVVRPEVAKPKDVQTPRVPDRPMPNDARGIDGEKTDKVSIEPDSGQTSKAERIAESPSRQTTGPATPPVQIGMATSFVHNTQTQSDDHDTGLLGEQDTRSLIGHRDHVGPNAVVQTEPIVGSKIPPDLQARNIQTVREALAHLRPDGTVEIAVDPPELGRIKLAMSGHEHQMSVVVTVDRPEVLDMIRRHVDLLKTELLAQGYTQFDFDFRRNDRDSSGPMTVDEDFASTDENDTHKNVPAQVIRLSNGRMDIRI